MNRTGYQAARNPIRETERTTSKISVDAIFMGYASMIKEEALSDNFTSPKEIWA
jgi:hypothetical protein